jgi:hypothetical protein
MKYTNIFDLDGRPVYDLTQIDPECEVLAFSEDSTFKGVDYII